MYEIVVTYRPDFAEYTVDRVNTEEEALQVARRIAKENHNKIVRVWIRAIGRVGSQG